MEINSTHLLIGVPTIIVGVVSLTVKVLNGRSGKLRGLYERIEQERKDADEKYVAQNSCHIAMDSLKEMRKADMRHLDDRLDDIKETIKNNGK